VNTAILNPWNIDWTVHLTVVTGLLMYGPVRGAFYCLLMVDAGRGKVVQAVPGNTGAEL